MQFNVIQFLKVIMSFFIVHVNLVLLVIDVKRISTIVKGLSVRKIIRIVSMDWIHLFANVNQILYEVRTIIKIYLRRECSIFLDADGLCVEQNPCLSSPCHTNATCYNLNGGQYRCMCPPTYTGIQCDEDIDECTVFPSICRNGGT